MHNCFPMQTILVQYINYILEIFVSFLLTDYSICMHGCINAESIRKLFKKIVYSEAGSNERRKEENAYMMFSIWKE